MKTSAIVILIASTATLACSGDSNADTVDIGETAALGQALQDYSGSWDGYVEAYNFGSGSDRLRITLSSDGEGTAELGDAPPVSAPAETDAGVSSPLAVSEEEDVNWWSELVPRFFEGFDYPVHDAQVENQRIRLHIKLYDLYAPWCKMQTPHLIEPGTSETLPAYYSCVSTEDWGSGEDSAPSCYAEPDDESRIGCSLAVCVAACSCTEDGCTGGGNYDESAVLDAALEDNGENLVGTLLIDDQRVTVRMTRQ